MKYCMRCGAQLPNEAGFCPVCGLKADYRPANIKYNNGGSAVAAPKPRRNNALKIFGLILPIIGIIITFFWLETNVLTLLSYNEAFLKLELTRRINFFTLLVPIIGTLICAAGHLLSILSKKKGNPMKFGIIVGYIGMGFGLLAIFVPILIGIIL